MSANFRWKGTSPPTIVGIKKTSVFLLPHSEDRVILCSFVWIGYQRVRNGRTDGQTDRRNCCRYYSAVHCKQCGRAVKTKSNRKSGSQRSQSDRHKDKLSSKLYQYRPITMFIPGEMLSSNAIKHL